MDGANMNALVGLCRPAEIGADVCHLNLHKTFCIPHGGGGPGMGPICVAEHLARFLAGPCCRTRPSAAQNAIGAVSAAPWGSASHPPDLLRLHRHDGRQPASPTPPVMAILNANYIAARLEPAYPVLYKGAHGRRGA